jgi:ribonuclease VapC
MIVDSSVMVALIMREEGYEGLRDKLLLSEELPRTAAPTYVETAIVLDGKRDPVVSRALDDLVAHFEMEVIPFDMNQAQIARQAYRDFGKGSGHPAKLNFGDCISYAAAKALGEPLLFVGNDFAATDIEIA